MAPLALLLLLVFPLSLADSCESNDCGATAPVDLLQRKLQVNNSLSLEGSRPNLLSLGGDVGGPLGHGAGNDTKNGFGVKNLGLLASKFLRKCGGRTEGRFIISSRSRKDAYQAL